MIRPASRKALPLLARGYREPNRDGPGRLWTLARFLIGRRKVGFLRRRPWTILSRLASRRRRFLARNTRLVAVVGSFGKSTTARTVRAALDSPWHQDPNRHRWSCLALSVLRIWPWHRHAVLEVGITERGEMAPYARMLRPNVTVVTCIGSEHNRTFGTLEVTRDEKAAMVRVLAPSGLAVLNGDDPNVRWMATQTRARVRTFGFEAGNDVRASDVAIDWPHGTRFTLHANGQAREVRTRLIGRHQVYAILAAVTVGLAEGFSVEGMLRRLETVRAIPGRMQLVPLRNGAFVLRDDFKSTLETVDAALDALAEIPARRRLVVLGDVSEVQGSQGPLYRRLGGRVGQIASRAIFVGPPSSVKPYRVGATEAGLPREAVVDGGRGVRRAVEALRADLGPGDVVLVKGRGSQRLDRVGLALMGHEVRCDISDCPMKYIRCASCELLHRGPSPPL